MTDIKSLLCTILLYSAGLCTEVIIVYLVTFHTIPLSFTKVLSLRTQTQLYHVSKPEARLCSYWQITRTLKRMHTHSDQTPQDKQTNIQPVLFPSQHTWYTVSSLIRYLRGLLDKGNLIIYFLCNFIYILEESYTLHLCQLPPKKILVNLQENPNKLKQLLSTVNCYTACKIISVLKEKKAIVQQQRLVANSWTVACAVDLLEATYTWL